MSDASALIQAVVAEYCPDAASATRLLDTALELEVDPLGYCAARLQMGEAQVMERAAEWAGLDFAQIIPAAFERAISPDRLEAIASTKLVSVETAERRWIYTAPEFLDVLRLKDQKFQSGSRPILVTKATLQDYLARCSSMALTHSARQTLTRKWPFATAQLTLTKQARYGFIALLVLLLSLVLAAPYLAQGWLLPLAICVLIGPSLIRLAALRTPLKRQRRPRRPPDAELPIYSVLIPLRDEQAMVPQLFAAMARIDYPPERLDIKFVVETRSPGTIAAVEERLGDARFSIVRVVDAKPYTKPKAINYALPLCRGEFVVVFDAEDIPDPDQLWKAALRFQQEPEMACLQARLVIANGHTNWLAALFAGEYAGLFGVLLPALANWQLPMPLGGTSNHFRISALRRIGGWDAYNVTEDADIGMRLARLRMDVDTLDSRTREAAPTRLRPWLGQRTRWMKGWMQTFIVHNLRPRTLVREMGWRAALGFEVLVLGLITSPILFLGFIVVTAFEALRGLPPWTDWVGWAALYGGFLALGLGSAFAVTILGLRRANRPDLVWVQLLLPVYWALIGIATIRAAVELARQPFHWFKSPHSPYELPPEPAKQAATLWQKQLGEEPAE
ncbi:glycosyltransferase family 2 protein [Devosia naphthalenivorans]|uniref:glycosyltransferase family 2 protein n=1 Tax=Devosia naphthalenivorans TaxID=2082392 RepID=UPI000D3CEA54|nr:glycosyltransferase family 2 protein [Devosia naphthalenivorans]